MSRIALRLARCLPTELCALPLHIIVAEVLNCYMYNVSDYAIAVCAVRDTRAERNKYLMMCCGFTLY